jgi:hypothetical protein
LLKKKVSELKELVEDLGIPTTGFLELADYVGAILNAQKNPPKKEKGFFSNFV